MAKKTEKKKKGPKGKRARAKAKLERQWGEEARETSAEFKRKGKSRLRPQLEKLAERKKFHEQEKISEAQDCEEKLKTVTSSDSDSASENEGGTDEDDLQEGAFSRLLKTIRGDTTNRRSGRHSGLDDNEEIDEEEDSEEADTNNMELEGDDESSSDDEIENDNSFENNDASFDPFGDRFSKTAILSEDEEKLDELTRQLHQQVEKIAVPFVDPNLELQVSKSTINSTILANTNNKHSWKNLARQSFGCNDDIVKRGWKQLESHRRRQSKAARTFSSLQSVLYPFLTRYNDALVITPSKERREQVSRVSLLHIANHVLTSRSRIQRNNRRIKSMADDNNSNEGNNEKAHEDGDEFKDQGYTRPIVLVLLPTRGTCHAWVNELAELLDASIPEDFKERFDTEYGAPVNEEEEGNENELRKRRKKVLEEKGSSWLELFGDHVNDDDDFKLGIALNTNTSKNNKSPKSNKSTEKMTMKVYTDFYSSDIIVASPLGLKMILTSDAKDEDADFLSSIEIVYIGRANVMMMQNWDHVKDVLSRVNELPKNNNDTDFSRVRPYFLAGQASHWRQLIVQSDLLDPSLSSTFKRFAKNQSGVIKTRQRIYEVDSSVARVMVPVRQVFQRIAASTFAQMGKDRMKYMTQKVLPSIFQNNQRHTMIFIPSYFDFVLLRNYLIKNEVDFVSVTEYSRVSETSRGRARFIQGRKSLMLYTGRAHFFMRHKIKGVRHLIFFGLPEHPEFYSMLVNVLNEGLETEDDAEPASSTALFTKYEAHALERIVGTNQSNRMIKGEKTTFMFLS